MATVNPQEDPTKQQQPGAPINVSGTAGASSSGQGGAGQTAGASPVATNTAPQANTGYTDIASYLDANQAGSQKLGTDVAQNLTNKYTQTQGMIGNSANEAINKANMGYTPANTDLINQVLSAPEAATPEQTSAFKGQLNDQYSGPQNWADFGSQQGNVAQAQQYGALPNTPGGLNVLTQELEGPQASQGVNQLDTMLLGVSPTAMASVKAASDPFATLTDYLNSQNQNVTGAISSATQSAEQARTGAQTALGGAQNQFVQGLQNRIPEAQQAAQLYNQGVGTLTGAANDINSQIQAYLAANPQLSGANNPLDPWTNLQTYNTAPNAANLATQQDYARAAALSGLSGGAFQGNPLQGEYNPANAWALPQDLQAALSNGAVPQALQQELQGLSGQITNAYAPWEAQQKLIDPYYNAESATARQQAVIEAQSALSHAGVKDIGGGTYVDQNSGSPQLSPEQQAAVQQFQTVQSKEDQLRAQAEAAGEAQRNMYDSLKWLPGAATGYNDLLAKLQQSAAPLQNIQLPTYGQSSSPDYGKLAADVGAAVNPVATLGNAAISKAILPAINNVSQNPINSGLAYLANPMTLGINPSVVNKIGSGIKNVGSQIGHFFGGLFAHGGEVKDVSEYLDAQKGK